MSYRGFAISSSVPEAPITEAIATALLENLQRLERWWVRELTDPQDPNARVWGCCTNVAFEWSDPEHVPAGDDWVLVQLVPALPPGSPEGDVAYHTTDEGGRPLALVLYTPTWTEAMSHEILETRVDATCQIVVPLPGGKLVTPREVCDWVQGSSYCEPTSPGIMLANAVGPSFFDLMAQKTRLDIASDVGHPAVGIAFQETGDGYHELIDLATGESHNVYGDRVTAATRARLDRTGPRGGKVRAAR